MLSLQYQFKVLYGKVLGIKSLILYEGISGIELKQDFIQDAALLAMREQKSLNPFVAESIREKVQRES